MISIFCLSCCKSINCMQNTIILFNGGDIPDDIVLEITQYLDSVSYTI